MASVVINTRFNNRKAEADLKELQAKAKETAREINAVEKGLGSATTKRNKLRDDLEAARQKAAETVAALDEVNARLDAGRKSKFGVTSKGDETLSDKLAAKLQQQDTAVQAAADAYHAQDAAVQALQQRHAELTAQLAQEKDEATRQAEAVTNAAQAAQAAQVDVSIGMARLAWLICRLHHTLYTAPYNPPISGKLCLKPAGASSESGRRRRHKSKEDLLVKTYCKPAEVNIENLDFIKEQVHLCFTGKRSKRRFQNLLVSTGKITRAELREEIRNCTCNKSLTAIDAVAEQAHADILARSVSFEPVRQFQLRENGKLRNICEESPWQQIFEYIAKGALDPLFRAKLLPIQYGSLPGKGQIAGKRQNERILRRMLHNKTDAAKCDVKKAYPSTTVECVMNLLRRDIGKNKPLLWLVEAVMANYPDGVLLIGGYLPCWLFNYVMSYVLRYILSHRKVRRGKSFKMILAICCYADDITVYGRISNLTKVMKDTTRWAKETLGLTIKSAWDIIHFASFDAERQQNKRRKAGSHQRTPGLDMMGYVVRRTYTIIRGRNFVKLRRAILRAQRDLDALGYVPWWRAQRIMSQWGEIKHSDSRGFCQKYNVYKIIRAAKRSVSWHSKQLLLKEQTHGAVC